MNLPDDCELTYVVPAEAWYRDVVVRDQPSVSIVAAARGGGCAWEFDVEEHDLNGPSLRLRMFDDSWDAFDQVPEFFAALREQYPRTLTGLRQLLDGIGARDATERVNPHAGRHGEVTQDTVADAIARWQAAPTRENRLALIGMLSAVEDERGEAAGQVEEPRRQVARVKQRQWSIEIS